jgi:hypothetical protein
VNECMYVGVHVCMDCMHALGVHTYGFFVDVCMDGAVCLRSYPTAICSIRWVLILDAN